MNDRIEAICKRDISRLENVGLVESRDRLKATELGEIMARYYVTFVTMERFLRMDRGARMSDIVGVSPFEGSFC